MKAIISPAKKLDFTLSNDPIKLSKKLLFESETNVLVDKMKTLKPKDLSKLMSLSDDLSILNFSRYQDFETAPSRAACFAFAGDTYQGLNISSFSKDDLEYAKDTVYILSGLYGLLRFNDPIRPYRLEMGVRLKDTQNGFNNLYQFWDTNISAKLNELNPNSELIVNLASIEYSKAIKASLLNATFINVHFVEEKKDKLVSVGFTSKRARGSMARYIVQTKAQKVSDLFDFVFEDHTYCPELSSETQLYFKKIK